MVRWQLGLKLRVVGVEPQIFVDNVDAASDGFFDGPADLFAPVADLGGDGAGIEEAIGIVCSETETALLRHVTDDEFIVEEEVELAVAAGDEIEGADVVGEPLQNLGSYPSCPQGVTSRDAVLDADVQLLDGTVAMVVGLLLSHGTPPGSSVAIVVRWPAAVNCGGGETCRLEGCECSMLESSIGAPISGHPSPVAQR